MEKYIQIVFPELKEFSNLGSEEYIDVFVQGVYLGFDHFWIDSNVFEILYPAQKRWIEK